MATERRILQRGMCAACVVVASAALADTWPGLNGGGTAANSSPTAIGTNLDVRWTVRLEPQELNGTFAGTIPFRGSIRSKNILIRGGELALLAPGPAGTDLAFYDAARGGIRRSVPSTLTYTTKAEWNTTGVEGRDLRNGQYMLFWHANGNVYCRSSGDGFQQVVLRAADGALQPNVGPSGSNQSGHFTMNDNSIWNFTSQGGHQGQITGFDMWDNGGTLGRKAFSSGGDGASFNYFTWCGAMLTDGDWFYTLGAATHPVMGWANYTTSTMRRNWLGTLVRGFRVLGQTPTAGNQNFVNGLNGSFTWKTTNTFVATDHDIASAIKPWCLGNSSIFVVTESASWTTNDATVDFSQPMTLSALDRTNGAVAFTLTLGISGAGCWMDKYFGYYGGGTTWRPQVAYADRTSTDGREYVSVLLPEAVEDYDWLMPRINPTNSNVSLSTRISVVDAVAKAELWTYQYPRGGTTPVLAQNVNTSTKQIIAGDALYVAYVKTAAGLDNYVSTNVFSALTLYVDRFALANGAKTSFQFPLGVQANTMQLDDLAAADGRLYALVTFREYFTGCGTTGGGQIVVALGSVTPGNQAPAFTAAPAASSTNITPPVIGVTLTAQATDPDGPAPSLAWNALTGPATVQFSTNNSAVATNVTATFREAGTYVIECRASDGELSATGTVQVTVNPPNTTVKVTVPDAMASEPGAAYGNGAFTLTRSGGDTSTPMTISVSITGTASNGMDYTFISNAIVIPAAATSTAVNVVPIDDVSIEGPETITLTIQSAPLLYLVGNPSSGTVTNYDDDIPATNVAPVASNLVIVLNEDTTAPVTLAGSDGNGDFLTFSIVSNPASGALAGSVPNLIYTPVTNYFGPDVFTYRVHDGYVYSATATGTITVVSINDPPVAQSQSLTVTHNGSKSITLTATDEEGDSLSYAIVSGPAHGGLTGTAPELIYTPTTNYSGLDSLTFTASDASSTSVAATVSITVYPSGFYAARNGRFNASDVDTWDKGLGVYPTNSGDIAYISAYTVTASNVSEVAARVTVELSMGGVLKLPVSGSVVSNVIHPNALVNVSEGGLLWVGTKQVCTHSNVLNGGVLALPPQGSLSPFGGVLTVVSDSTISNSATSSIDLRSTTHGGGKLTLKGLNSAADNVLLASSSTWTGNWDVADSVQLRFGTTSNPQSVPRGIRVGNGATAHYNLTATIKGTLSGTGTNKVYQGSAFTIGATNLQGVVSPGDNGPGNLTLISYTTGNYGPTLAFASNSVYQVEVAGTSSYDRVTVAGVGSGTGKVTIAAGATLNVTLWTPTDSVSLDATIIDTAMTNGANGLLTGSFNSINWSNTNGWTGLTVTNIANDLHVTGSYTPYAADANTNGIPDAWETQYFGSTTSAQGAADADWDGDGLDNRGEWVAGTNPTNDQSVLAFSNLVQTAGNWTVLRWSSESSRFYTLKLSTNLALDPFSLALTNRMPAVPPVNTYTDQVQRPGGTFYRITVENQ